MQHRRMLFILLGTLLVGSLGTPAAASSFVDVPDDNPFVDDIEWLAAEGITLGCNAAGDRFCPTDYVTRGQMAAFLNRALGLAATSTDFFTDDDGSIFEDDINRLAAAGITQGCDTGLFCPTDYVTRQQMAAFLHRAIDPAPLAVTGLIVTLSGGSGEIDVSWEPNPETDIDHYNVWFSELPGPPKTLVPEPYFFGPEIDMSGRWYIIDWPRDQTAGESCYQISAVDLGGQEGPRSLEECFDPVPGTPAQVMDVTVGLGGGSEEVYVSWTPNGEGDIDFYNAYFSELPGGPYTYATSVDEAVRDGSNRVFFIDFPRDQTVGRTCYAITAVDFNEKEGPTSAEACFDPSA